MKKIYFSVIVCFLIAFSMLFALAEITGISPISPANNVWTNDTTPAFTFNAISNTSATFSCGLYIDNALNATISANNNTDTQIASTALSQGTHSWYINCTDTNSMSSTARTIYIDTTAPTVAIDSDSPDNETDTSSHRIDFVFKATDNLDDSLDCRLYVDNDEEDDLDAENNSKETFENIDLDADDHEWYIECTDSAGNTGQSETRTLTVEGYCEKGERGDVEITKFYDIESGDKFYIGDSITVKVKVENNANDDLDIKVEAELYDEDDADDVETAEETIRIDEDESATITLNITVPSNADPDHDFTVRVKAYEEDNEEEQCDENSVSIDIKQESHSVIIDDVDIEPETATCGSIANLAFDVLNVGSNDEKVKIEVISAFTNWTTTTDLDEGDDAYEASVPIEIPRNISDGDYTITIKANYDYSSSYRAARTESAIIKVQGNCQGPPAPDASLSTTQTSDAFVGSSFVVKLKVTNSGNVGSTYAIDATDYEDWATLSKIEPETMTLGAGSTGYAYISLIPNENATGMNSFKAIVTFGSTTKEQVVNVEIKKPTEPASGFDQFMFELKRNWQWFLLIILLIAVVVILAILLGKQARYHARQKRSDRFDPTEIRIRTAKDLKEMRKQKNGRVVRNF